MRAETSRADCGEGQLLGVIRRDPPPLIINVSWQELALAHAAASSGDRGTVRRAWRTPYSIADHCQKSLLTKFFNPPMLIRETEG
ncbi:hypothetical protein CIT31_09510 [Mesorhizobium wenxiniae]|uniref:Uncharacterized protein n=2 Tax=Mesorhizobium wenxiniae TaxID=2014805 RepID=A0A271KKS7_9HYPH|nr:hypothetical protein CIT31_09510 [Mesorhizobium wenxiniae]